MNSQLHLKIKLLFIIVINILKYVEASNLTSGWGIVGNPIARAYPCKGNQVLEAIFEPGLSPDEENKYELAIYEKFPAHSRVTIKFDSEATVTLADDTVARIKSDLSDLEVSIRFFKSASRLIVTVKGPQTGTVPYPTSIDVNTVEYCKEPDPGFLDNHLQGYKGTAHVALSVPTGSCGRRKVQHTELIVNGQPTKPGDWPWHGAIYRLEQSSVKYVCGGTLLSKIFVLTAAHCSTINGKPVLPEILSVIFGKYQLIGGDVATQEREIHQVIVHEEYKPKRLDNDISLLKMKTEITYDDYVQPACLWNVNAYKKLPVGTIMGTQSCCSSSHVRSMNITMFSMMLFMLSVIYHPSSINKYQLM
ncbi:uncharacterized protein LOC113512769 isoform X2 [Galleria mellonella]|uniref:Uncharacterized protein LOC113512769 isoform X2 n=1 Tax=Galleria mellonella TaxID=7137 RepID=A0ABM3MEF9_GALME|nr:uncharacterized protein LOC113512769 isoform X2 [Galleria mellonella]